MRQKLPTLDQLETVMDEARRNAVSPGKMGVRGYTNPENTIVSLATAALAGDLETFLNSMTPDFRARQRENMQKDGKTEVQWRDQLAKEFGRTESITILKKGDLSENEVILTLLIDNGGGRTETPKMKVQRIGNEWKVAGHPIRGDAGSKTAITGRD